MLTQLVCGESKGRFIVVTDDNPALRKFIRPLLFDHPLAEVWTTLDLLIYLYLTRKEVTASSRKRRFGMLQDLLAPLSFEIEVKLKMSAEHTYSSHMTSGLTPLQSFAGCSLCSKTSQRWQLTFRQLGFKKNPFNIVPDTETNELVWAGFNSTKIEFEKVMKSCLASDETKVLLNLSRYGGGKTHAAYYFAKHSSLYLPEGASPPLHLIPTVPKLGDNAIWEIYIKLIEAISFKAIIASLKGHRASVGQEKALEQLQTFAKSEDVGRLIWLLADEDEDVAYLAGEVLMSGKATVPVRRKLRLRRGIETNSDASLILSALINVLARYKDGADLHPAKTCFHLAR